MSESDPPCPICAKNLEDAQSVFVCGQCHGQLASTGAIQVHVTGEFPAVLQMAMLPEDGAPEVPARPRRPTDPADHNCTWCDKPGDQVKKLLTHGVAKICNECVALCADIMQAEIGDDWR